MLGRVAYLGYRHGSPSLAFLFFLKACLFTFDIVSSCLFLYVFLVPLGVELFGKSPDIPLFLTVIISSPIVTTISNAFINLPLVYTHTQIETNQDGHSAFRTALSKLYSPQVSIFTLFALYNASVILYMMSKLEMIILQPSPNLFADLVQWNPRRFSVWMIGVNLVANYLIGIASTVLYWILSLFRYAMCQ
jgi:hypothetical protein